MHLGFLNVYNEAMILVAVYEVTRNGLRPPAELRLRGQKTNCILDSRFANSITVADLLYRQRHLEILREHLGTSRIFLRNRCDCLECLAYSQRRETTELR